ncbi:putative E3 ubiquitin ligase complex SCF subunit sconB [Cytospora mali]|uniref:E3 ubiquitin ligase complex SCF subunit sconB n=1 Tax=Cytospora mali TaxID=578113 RepID=A0A194VZH3_CYTMA|nr:putative E3 ubiquitin ligase complex SCF subunit sconB [Valsa mali]
MHPKRSRPSNDNGDNVDIASSSSLNSPAPRAKRQRLANPTRTTAITTSRTGADLLSPLPSEILIRILSYLSLPQLLSVSPVSRRFHHLADDSQLWKALYYARFVLPRAMRIPGFRDGKLAERIKEHKLHYKGRRALWASGRAGGLVNDEGAGEAYSGRIGAMLEEEERKGKDDRVNWKRQFKIRHNWARGKCAVEELKLGTEPEDEDPFTADDDGDRSKMLVKVVEGFAVTADRTFGLRAWDLKTREVVAQISLEDDRPHDDGKEADAAPPSCIAIDDHHLYKGTLGIALGFTDGSFGVWRLDLQAKTIARRYRHENSSNGCLAGMAYSHPFLLTATVTVLVSLYTFNVPRMAENEDEEGENLEQSSSKLATAMREYCDDAVSEDTAKEDGILLPAPYLLTALKSHTSDPPLALSIRDTGNTTVASIAYTFYTRRGWSIGIQDLHITADDSNKSAPNITTRLAYTAPISFSGAHSAVAPPRTPLGRRIPLSPPQVLPPTTPLSDTIQPPPPPPIDPEQRDREGPTTLCYSHPYLLATLPDNTLILHLCTSTSSTLSISPGIRLWGHTSGISDAEITARGKAVSVSSRGDEMRVWELEGRPNGLRSRSVEIRPMSVAVNSDRGWVDMAKAGRTESGTSESEEDVRVASRDVVDWKERRNWVGFDDEMVIVLKEARGGRESLLVYDFT